MFLFNSYAHFYVTMFFLIHVQQFLYALTTFANFLYNITKIIFSLDYYNALAIRSKLKENSNPAFLDVNFKIEFLILKILTNKMPFLKNKLSLKIYDSTSMVAKINEE